MNRLFSAFACGLMSLLVVSCTGETVDYTQPVEPAEPAAPAPEVAELPEDIPEAIPPTDASAPLSSLSSDAIRNLNDFSVRFYLANSAGTHQNVCVSPFSVGAVLGMMANGDDGAARNNILKMLGFVEREEGLNELNTYFQTLLSNLPNLDEGVSCSVTNTLWCDPLKYRIRKSFMEALGDYYYGYGIGISPAGEKGKEAINAFVSKNTNGLITDFLRNPLSVELAFLNTVYFKAGWTEAFDEYDTHDGTFINIAGTEQTAYFMKGYDPRARYAMTEDGTEAVSINYGENEKFSMTLVLPSSDENNIYLDEVLTPGIIEEINGKLKRKSIIVELPKFEVEMNNPNTLDILKGLGLSSIGDAGMPTGFGLITDSSEFYLNCFIHATKIKVDEEGTEGAAASLGGMTSGVPHFDGHIKFDRPFIFYIQENTTGAILFIGSVKTFS